VATEGARRTDMSESVLRIGPNAAASSSVVRTIDAAGLALLGVVLDRTSPRRDAQFRMEIDARALSQSSTAHRVVTRSRVVR
jgi:hypothetical protein